MLFLLQLIIFMALGSFIGLLIYKDPGYLLLNYENWIIEMPLWVAVLITLITGITLWASHRIFKNLLLGPHNLKCWWKDQRFKKQIRNFNKGWIDLIAQDHAEAQRHFLNAASNYNPVISYIGAAQAAHECKEYAQRDFYLSQAKNKLSYKKYIITYLKAEWLLQEGKCEESLKELEVLPKKLQNLSLFLKLKIKLYQLNKNYSALAQTIQTFRKISKNCPEQWLNHVLLLESDAWHQTLSLSPDLATLKKNWSQRPKALQQNAQNLGLELYLHQLLKFNAKKEFLNLIYKTLKPWTKFSEHAAFNPQLIALLVDHVELDASNLLKLGQQLLKTHPQEPSLYLLTGQAAAHLKLWGQAKGYFERYLRFVPEDARIREQFKQLSVHWGR